MSGNGKLIPLSQNAGTGGHDFQRRGEYSQLTNNSGQGHGLSFINDAMYLPERISQLSDIQPVYNQYNNNLVRDSNHH